MKKASALLGSLLFSVGLLAVSGQAVKADTVQPAQTTATEQVQTTQTTAEQTATDQTTDQVATNAPAVSQQSTTQINYVKGYGVNLWQLNADQSVSWTGRRLTTGTKWKTFGYTDLSKSQQRVYNLGGNQWIYAQYLVDAGTKQKVAGYQAASSQTKPSGQTPAQTTDITPAANGTVGIVGYRPS